MACGPLPCVARFIAEFERLSPELRDKAVGEMAGFCQGYVEGREEMRAILESMGEFIRDDTPSANDETNEVSAKTLAATMTEMDIKPHRGRRGGKAPAPGGWS